MTTTDSSFVAQGALSGLGSYPVGFYANSKSPRAGAAGKPFQVGTLAVGQVAGVYGTTDEVVLPSPLAPPPGVSFWSKAGVQGYSVNGFGVAGYSDSGGVFGLSTNSIGVQGQSTWYSGVEGLSPRWYGVRGWSWTSYGVRGESFDSSGVVGVSGNLISPVGIPTTAGVTGVAGLPGPALSQAPQQGNTIKPPTAGVLGTANQHPGVIGTSNGGIGVYGFSTGNSGVMGESVSSWAGYFAGNVNITGNLTVAGPMKGAVVPFPDGTQRVLLCMESPEAWFEDFGAGKLKRGRAVVKIDANFAKVIKRGNYHVFLTPRGDCRGLYVRRQGGASFEVREFGGGASSVAFSYRIIGRRKDIKGHRRFAKIDTRLPVPRARPVQSARRAKMPSPTPAELRAFAARMEKERRAHMAKLGRKGKGS
jgi:hypothetical protein